MLLHTVFTLAEHGGDAVLALPAVLPWGAGGWKELGTLTPHCFTCVVLSALENLTGMKLSLCLRCQHLDQRMKL